MMRWQLLLPPPALLTSPSRSRCSSSSIVVEAPSCHPLPSSCYCGRTVPRSRAAPSITLNLPSRRSSPPIAVVHSVHRCPARAVPRLRGAVTPSIAVAVEEPSRRPSPSRSRRAIPCRRGVSRVAICIFAIESISAVQFPLYFQFVNGFDVIF